MLTPQIEYANNEKVLRIMGSTKHLNQNKKKIIEIFRTHLTLTADIEGKRG